MSDRNVISGKIRKKELEIQSLEEKLRAAKVYIQALKDVWSALGSDPDDADSLADAPVLKPGSALALARNRILETGRPMHVDELLRAAGKEPSRETKVSLSSSLSSYVRKKEIFTRPGMNTFGLIELQHFSPKGPAPLNEPPPGFGRSGNGLAHE